jgi:hypothetical protein
MVSCLKDSVGCLNGTITSNYTTSTFDTFCVPTTNVNNQDLSQILNTNIYSAWATDLRQGWIVLVSAAGIAMVASLLFLFALRCFSGFIIWVSIFICLLGMELIGIMFILQAKGINISPYVPTGISKLSYDSLIIIGSGLIVGGTLLAFIVCCLRTRIAMGSRSV